MKEFAEDKDKFFSVYRAAHLKMSELGHVGSDLKPIGDILSTKIKFYDVRQNHSL